MKLNNFENKKRDCAVYIKMELESCNSKSFGTLNFEYNLGSLGIFFFF